MNLKDLSPKEIGKITERNFEIFKSELNGQEIKEPRIDICWFCGELFNEFESEFCEQCLTYKCKYCGRCFCDLPPIAKQALEREMLSLGLWHLNPRRRKKKRPASEEMEFEIIRLPEKTVVETVYGLSKARERVEALKKEHPGIEFDFRVKGKFESAVA